MTDEGNDRDRLINAAIKASIKFEERMDKTDFDSWLDRVCLFNWNTISENDYELLIKYLNDNFEINGIETSNIEKSRDGKTISVPTRGNSLSLKLKDKETKGNLEIDGVSVRKFTVETKGDKLNIYFTDSSETLKELGQFNGPFKIYETNRNMLRRICDQMKLKADDKSSLEKKHIYSLFEAKIKRLEARICSNKNDEQEKYKEALHCLLSALNEHNKFCLQMKQNESNKSPTQEEDNAFDMLLILLYNDLSICYAGLDNSSMSRGYAEEAGKIIKKNDAYKKFDLKFSTDRSNMSETAAFVSSNPYKLYMITLFNQALAEKHLKLNNDAERNFRKIIDYAEVKYIEGKTKDKKDNPPRNFNYYSALLNLSDLYIDLSRGREAIDLLHKVSNDKKIAKEKDIRYWKAYLYEINALIDQSNYDEADRLLKTFKTKEADFTLKEKHKVTSTGFKGLACYARCEIEKVKNTLRNNEKSELIKAKEIIKTSIKDIRKRKQLGLETKTYKHLSEIDKLLYKDDTPMEYFIKYLSKGKIDNLKVFAENEQMDKWIRDCKDLEFLESFTDQIIRKVKRDGSIKVYSGLLRGLEKKIIKECDDKGQLARSEKVATKLDYVRGVKNHIKYDKIAVNNFFGENAKGLTAKEIATSLYITEKEFDSFLFKRSKLKDEKHIVEMIVLRRWNSFSPGLFRGSTGSLGGGYFLRIKKNPLFSFSEIPTDEKQQKQLLEHLRTRGYKQQAKSLENAEYTSKDNKRIEVTKNGIKIAILEIKNDSCYLKKGESDIKIGIVKEDDDKLNIYPGDSYVENIVIDPGYNFIQNFCSEGFGIDDIDMIIVTHSHIDHCAELLPIMDLIYQINNRYKKCNEKKERPKKKVNLCLSKGVYDKFSSYIADPKWQQELKDVIILENLDKEKWPFEGLEISAIPTHHGDLWGVKAIGLMIKIDRIVDDNEENSKALRLGFTSDTPWYSDIKQHFKECDLLCVHLGSIECQEIGYEDNRYESVKTREIETEEEKEKKFEETYTKSDHLLFFGTERIMSDYNETNKDSLIIVGEFGEELKYGLRVELCKKLSMGKTQYLFSFSDITKGKRVHELLDSLRALDHSDLAKILEGAEYYSEKWEEIRITKNDKRIATLKIEEDLCYLERDNHKFEIGVVKKEDDNVKIYKKSIVCLPGDIGQYIVIENNGAKKVRCTFCEHFVSPDEITTCSSGREDALHYICKLCNKTLSEIQKQAFIEHRVTRH